MRDQELADEMYLSRNAYDAHGPYDMDFDSGPAAGPSRPSPIPYDDPYGEEYTAPVAEPSNIGSAIDSTSLFDSRPSFGRGSGGGRGYDRGEHQGKRRGQGKDRRGQRDRGKSGRGGGGYRSSHQHSDRKDARSEFDDSRSSTTRSLSPTSLAIARATGQAPHQQSFSPMYAEARGTGSSWGYDYMQPQAQYQYGYMQQPYQPQQVHMQGPLVQPHINPRFASAFGIAINAMQQFNQNMTASDVSTSASLNLAPTSNNIPGPRSSFHWTNEWKAEQGSPASHHEVESKNIEQ